MNYQEAMQYIKKIRAEYASDYTLDDVTQLCERAGRPDKKLRIIHIAGTNGKGSVGAYISNALAMSGYTVGRFVSPALIHEREQIQKIYGTSLEIQTEYISEEEAAENLTVLAGHCEEMVKEGWHQPTAFEIETVMALRQMALWHVDVAVIETGMGGRLDATNLIEKPVLTVFTRISLDHTAILGDTLEQITEQKLGILKDHVPAVTVRQTPEVMELIRTHCQRRGLHLRIADIQNTMQQDFQLSGTEFLYKGRHYHLNQLGMYQMENALLAIEAMEELERIGFYKVNESSTGRALRETKWPGRFEVISRSPYMILDGAHNPSGAQMLRRSLEIYFPTKRFTYVFGVFRDKDYHAILDQMLPLARRVYTVNAVGSRAVPSGELAQIVRKQLGDRPVPVADCATVAEALEQIRRSGRSETVVVFGSLSFLHEIYRYYDTLRYIN